MFCYNAARAIIFPCFQARVLDSVYGLNDFFPNIDYIKNVFALQQKSCEEFFQSNY